jgi:hypothetical protein
MWCDVCSDVVLCVVWHGVKWCLVWCVVCSVWWGQCEVHRVVVLCVCVCVCARACVRAHVCVLISIHTRLMNSGTKKIYLLLRVKHFSKFCMFR